MRIISTLCLLLISFQGIAQQPVSAGYKPVFVFKDCFVVQKRDWADTLAKKQLPACKTGEQKPATIRLRCGMTMQQTEPLLVVDGIPITPGTLSALNPNDIESISILKNATAIAIYGYRAGSGVILITTRSSGTREFTVKDFTDGSSIPGATLTFTSAKNKTDTLMFVADENGKVITGRLKKGIEYAVTVTSVGYKSYNVPVMPSGKSTDLLLERDVRVNEEVIVTGYGVSIRCCTLVCGGWCKKSKCTIVDKKKQELITANRIYPNPVQRSQSLTAEMESPATQKIQVSLVTMGGQIIIANPYQLTKGANRITINTSGSWPAGTYVLLLSSATKQIIYQQKIIIQ